MKREIKFRAWVPKTAQMIMPVGVDPYYVNDLDRFHWPHDQVELMQFVGVPDKNAADIYEGDIVRFRMPVRTTQTHEGDNIPNGSYTEPMEPGIAEYEGEVKFANGVFYIDCDRPGVDVYPIMWDDREWPEEEIKHAIAIYKQGKEYSIWDSPEEGDLQYLLETYKLKDLAELIEYLRGIEIIGNVYQNPSLLL